MYKRIFLIFLIVIILSGCKITEPNVVEYEFDREDNKADTFIDKSDRQNEEGDLTEYENQLLQFKLSYPNYLNVIENNPFKDLSKIDYEKVNDFLFEVNKGGESSGYKFQINILTNPREKDIVEWYKDFYKNELRKNHGETPLSKTGEFVKVNDYNAYKVNVINDKYEEVRYIIPNESIVYYINEINQSITQEERQVNRKEIDKILSSFEIIKPSNES